MIYEHISDRQKRASSGIRAGAVPAVLNFHGARCAQMGPSELAGSSPNMGYRAPARSPLGVPRSHGAG